MGRLSENLFHEGVTGFDDTIQVNGEQAHIQGLDDIFAEVLEAGDFEGLLFKRAVKLRVIEGDSDVTGNRLDQLDVIAGQIISIPRLAETENRNGVLADAAGDKGVWIQLL